MAGTASRQSAGSTELQEGRDLHTRARLLCDDARDACAQLAATRAMSRQLVEALRAAREERRRRPPATEPPCDGAPLTRRQREILAELAAGASTDELAARLYVSRTTIRNHIAAILRALGAHSRLEAVAIARRRGLL